MEQSAITDNWFKASLNPIVALSQFPTPAVSLIVYYVKGGVRAYFHLSGMFQGIGIIGN